MMLDNLLTFPFRRLLSWRMLNKGQVVLPVTTNDTPWSSTLKVSELADRYLINVISLSAGCIFSLIFAVLLNGDTQMIAIIILLVMMVWTTVVSFARDRLIKLNAEISTLTIEAAITLMIGSAFQICVKSVKGEFKISKTPRLIWKVSAVGSSPIEVLRVNCRTTDSDMKQKSSVHYCDGFIPKDALHTDLSIGNVYAEFQLWIQGFKFAFLVPIRQHKSEVGV